MQNSLKLELSISLFWVYHNAYTLPILQTLQNISKTVQSVWQIKIAGKAPFANII